MFHVDNTAAAGGDGSLDTPFNTLADANAAAGQAGDVIYINRGDGTSTGMDQGLTIASDDQSVIGSGSAFVYDGGRFTTATGQSFSGSVLRAAGTAPVMTNGAGSGITVAAAGVSISGVTVDGATQHGIYAAASGGDDLGTLTLQNVTLSNNADDGLHVAASGAGSAIDAALTNVRAEGNHNGIRYYAQDNGSVTGMMESSVATANTQHGVIIYDDSTAGSIDVDLGGGARSSGLNGLYSNDLEDLAVELDGATLMAQNNWWGQTSGPDTDSPAVGIAPQIYYGAPIDDGLTGHWTFDSQWLNATTAYDRSGNNNDGTLQGGLSLADVVAGQNREALDFDGIDDQVSIANVASINPVNVTVSAWAQFSSLADRPHIIGKGTGGVGAYWLVVETDGRPAFFYTKSGGGWSNIRGPVGSILPNTPYFFTGVYDGINASIYVNGVTLNSIGNPGTLSVVDANALKIARNANNMDSYNGFFDEGRIYSRALDPSEIAELYRMDSSSGVDTSGFLSAAP